MTGDLAGWRKSSHSKSGNCVEVGSGPAVIAVRDSKLAESPVLTFGRESWAVFVAQVKAA